MPRSASELEYHSKGYWETPNWLLCIPMTLRRIHRNPQNLFLGEQSPTKAFAVFTVSCCLNLTGSRRPPEVTKNPRPGGPARAEWGRVACDIASRGVELDPGESRTRSRPAAVQGLERQQGAKFAARASRPRRPARGVRLTGAAGKDSAPRLPGPRSSEFRGGGERGRDAPTPRRTGPGRRPRRTPTPRLAHPRRGPLGRPPPPSPRYLKVPTTRR